MLLPEMVKAGISEPVNTFGGTHQQPNRITIHENGIHDYMKWVKFVTVC